MLSTLLIFGCTINGNYLGVSQSVKDSKHDGFLERELVFESIDFSLDTLGELKFDEAFIEKIWRSNNDLSKTATGDSQIILTLKDPIPKRYSFDWVCKIENGSKFSKNGNLLVTNISQFEMSDTIKIQVFRGDVFYLKKSDQPIYTFSLVSK